MVLYRGFFKNVKKLICRFFVVISLICLFSFSFKPSTRVLQKLDTNDTGV